MMERGKSSHGDRERTSGPVACWPRSERSFDLGELGLKGFSDAGVKRASRLAEQHAIDRVLHQGMLEQTGRMRRHALPEQQSGRH